MNRRRRAGTTLLVLGLLLVGIGSAGYLLGRGGAGTAATPSPTPLAATPTASLGTPASPPAMSPLSPSPSPTANPTVLVTSFFADLSAAIRAGTVGVMTGRLHPATIDRYGADRCAQEMATRAADPTYAIVILEVLPPAPWAYETDGLSTTIADATTVRARVTALGAATERDLHVVLVDGAVRWFTDCGNPPVASPAGT